MAPWNGPNYPLSLPTLFCERGGRKLHSRGKEAHVALLFVIKLLTAIVRRKLLYEQEAFEKCWAYSLLRAVLHCHSPSVATAATVARRLRIDVHDDDDDNA